MTHNESHWPNAFVVGAAKAGTNTLHSLFKQHPDIFVPSARVSLGFFSPDLDYPLRIRSESEYLAFFAKAKNETIRAEVSSLYLASDIAAEKIAERNPSSKIIITLRNPVEATYAAHNQLVYDGWENETDFSSALAAEENRSAGRIPLPKRGVSPGNFLYKRTYGNYDLQIKRYWEVFGREQVLIFLFEDLIGDPLAAAAEIYRFLGVDPDFKPQFGINNPSKFVKNPLLLRSLQKIPAPLENMIRRTLPPRVLDWSVSVMKNLTTTYKPRPPMNPEVRESLCEEYGPMVERLGKMLDRDLSGWVQPAESR